MSKLLCGRCGKKVNVVENTLYKTDMGKIYCDSHCHYNRNIPMDISKQSNRKLRKKKMVNLYIVKDHAQWEEVFAEVKWRDDNGLETVVMDIEYKKNTDLLKWWNRYHNNTAIKRIEYRTELSDEFKNAIELLKKLTNAKTRV